jgi:hypothetical protein
MESHMCCKLSLQAWTSMSTWRGQGTVSLVAAEPRIGLAFSTRSRRKMPSSGEAHFVIVYCLLLFNVSQWQCPACTIPAAGSRPSLRALSSTRPSQHECFSWLMNVICSSVSFPWSIPRNRTWVECPEPWQKWEAWSIYHDGEPQSIDGLWLRAIKKDCKIRAWAGLSSML